MDRFSRENAVQTPLTSWPDRSLEPGGELPAVAIRGTGQHPFVFRKMIIGPVGAVRPGDGDLVRVVDRDERTIGFGLWNIKSEIRLRMLALEPKSRAKRSLGEPDRQGNRGCWRESLALDAVTNAYRVVHAEGDGLSGLIVDRFDDVLSVEVFSLGIYHRIGPLLQILASRLGVSHLRVTVDERIAEAEELSPVARSRLPGLPARSDS